MGVFIHFGILDREDPSDPASQPLIRWPAWRDVAPAGASPNGVLPDQPTRSLSARAWSTWRERRGVRAILAHCGVPAEVTTCSCAPIDDQLLILLAQLHTHEQRWAWLPWRAPHADRAQWLLDWAQRARATFGAQARISFS